MKRIDILPDDVLLGVFDFYVDRSQSYGDTRGIETWQSLVHVCRQWRSLVFQTPRRLNLRLVCTPCTPARAKLDIWPALPFAVVGNMVFSGTDNVVAALQQSDRVYRVHLSSLVGRPFRKISAAMQGPFPELTDLRLSSHGERPPVIPDSFLDGSARRLQYFELSGILFPELPNLLLSANHLVHLFLLNIPHSGFISPEVIVALLSVLSSLELLSLQFQYSESQPFPDWESPSLPPPRRSIVPALDQLSFKGVTDYLEDLVTFIDTPQLNSLYMTFFSQIDFDCPRLAQFINCTPKFRALDEAHVQFDDGSANVTLRSRTSKSRYEDLLINIPCCEIDWQLSSIQQVCNFSLPPSYTVEDLYIEHQYSELVWKDVAIDSENLNTLWLQLLLPFTAVKNLYLSKEFALDIAAALQGLIDGRSTELLPSLQNIFVEGLEPSGPFQENIGQFVTARQLSDHPIAIFNWDQDSDMKSM